MSDKKLIICDLDHKDVKPEEEVFRSAGYEFDRLCCKTQRDVIENCRNAVVLMNQYIKMDSVIFEALPALKCIVRYGVGVDNVDLADARAFGVEVCNVPDYGTQEVADQALALMLCLTRKVCLANALVHEGVWDYRHEIPVFRLSEATVGIFGFGRIGRAFAKRASALGARILACDIRENLDMPDYVTRASKEELLQQSDILSLHCPLTPETYHAFGKAEFSAMKSSACIINVSRGGIIDEMALYRALCEKQIAGAGIDVAEKEPLAPDNPLLSLDNFIVTPHTAWYSEQSALELKRKVAEEAVLFISGKKVRYSVLN